MKQKSKLLALTSFAFIAAVGCGSQESNSKLKLDAPSILVSRVGESVFNASVYGPLAEVIRAATPNLDLTALNLACVEAECKLTIDTSDSSAFLIEPILTPGNPDTNLAPTLHVHLSKEESALVYNSLKIAEPAKPTIEAGLTSEEVFQKEAFSIAEVDQSLSLFCSKHTSYFLGIKRFPLETRHSCSLTLGGVPE